MYQRRYARPPGSATAFPAGSAVPGAGAGGCTVGVGQRSASSSPGTAAAGPVGTGSASLAAVLDPEMFAQAFVDQETRTVAWPNGADLAPEFLHEIGRAVETDAA